jgi:hypothetical protein
MPKIFEKFEGYHLAAVGRRISEIVSLYMLLQSIALERAF